MASIGQVADHMNGTSPLASMHPAAFSHSWPSDYSRDRYVMEMRASSYPGRPSSINRTGYHQLLPSVDSAPSVWQQRQESDSDGILAPRHRILPADNNINSGSIRGGVAAARMPAGSILGSSDCTNRGSSGSVQLAQSSSSELYEGANSTPVAAGDWQQFVDSDAGQYSSLIPSTTIASSNGLPLPSPSSVGGGAMIRELLGKLGGSMVSRSSNDLLSSGPSPSQQRAGGGLDSLAATVKLSGAAGNHCWNGTANGTAGIEIPSNVGRGLTIDPSKGGLSLNHRAVVATGLATSHCLSPFTADPGFAERAARFSSFSNGNYAHTFPSDFETGGLARMRPRSSASQLCPRNSSSPSSVQQETVGRVISNDSGPSERMPGSRIREIQSGNRGASVDLVASAVTVNKDDDSSLEQNYARVEGYPASKTLSGTVSNLMGSARNSEEVGAELQRTTSIDTSSDRTQATSTFTSEQADSAGPEEGCPSPGARSGANDIPVKKRKPTFEERPPSKHVGSGSASPHHDKDGKMAENEEAKVKRLRRCDGEDDMKGKADRSSSETSGESSPRPTKEHSKPSSEHPKTDYIHVRARRGQATDSHSLAERVRREKISERMKFLQDLVPGCSKVTGKAVMLDEIINYVQSLQRQVEFLSMKLASVNPRLDFHHESFLGKEGTHPGSQAMVVGAETSIAYPPLQPQHRTPLQQRLEYQLHEEAAIRRSMSAVLPVVPAVISHVDSFEDGVRQTMWDDGDSELNSIVQMGFGNSQAMSSQGLQCNLPPGQVKVELQQSPITCL